MRTRRLPTPAAFWLCSGVDRTLLEEHRNRVITLFEEVVNAHDSSAIERFTASPSIQGTLRGLLAGFADLRFDVMWTVAEGDRVGLLQVR